VAAIEFLSTNALKPLQADSFSLLQAFLLCEFFWLLLEIKGKSFFMTTTSLKSIH
jgi:hypothetical protein